MALEFLNDAYFAAKVGIGIETYSKKLTIFGTGAGNATVQIEGEGGADPYINFLANNTQHWSLGIDDSDSDKFKLSEHSALGTNDYFVVDTSGNVGIGTDSPTAKLQVAGTTTYNSDSAQALRVCDAADISKGIHIGFDTTLDKGIIQSGDFGVAYKDLLLNPNAGNVGIGTITPDSLLHIQGSTYNRVQTYFSGAYISGFKFSDLNGGIWYDAGADDLHLSAAQTNSQMLFEVAGSERMRITSTGGISFGSTGTAYGTSGQVLTSAGNASPTWTTPTTGTVKGTGTATEVAFWTANDTISSDDGLYWDNTNKHLGINDITPGSPLKVVSAASETSLYTVDIRHVRDDANVATAAQRINMDLSGADTTTADRINYGLYLDIDSSANGDAANEHRIDGVGSFVNFTGFSDDVRAGFFNAESNYTGGKTESLIGVSGSAVHDTSNVAGGVSNMYGVFGRSSIQDLGDVDSAFGGYFAIDISASRGNANVGITKGVEGHINIDKAATITYGEMMAFSGIIDNNETTFPTFGNQYLFKGDYQGTRGGNAYGIYCEGDKHYFEGNVGIGVTGPSQKLDVSGSAKISTNILLGTAGVSNSIYFADATSTQNVRINSYTDNTLFFDNFNGQYNFRTTTSYISRLFINNTGNVGIGTASPTEKLEVAGNIKIQSALLSNQENTDVDTGTEAIASVAIATYTAAFFDFVIKKGTNVRSGTVYACHDGTSVAFTETSTQDLGDTSDVTLNVVISTIYLQLQATTTSDDWSVKSLIRAI